MLVLTWLLACSGTEAQREVSAAPALVPQTPSGQVIAKVGEHGAVTVDDFSARASRQMLMQGTDLTEADRKQILDDLVDDEVLFQEAFAQGLYRDPKVRQVMINLLKRREVVEQAKAQTLTDEQAEAYFQAHIADFRMPEKAQVKRIFIGFGQNRTEDEAAALAKDLRAQIVADPTKFRELAEKYSEDSYARRGGDLGYVDNVPESPFPPEFLQAAFSLEVGKVSEPFVAGGGYNILLVRAKRDAIERTFEQMKGTVLRRMRSEMQTELTEKYTEGLRARTPVTVDEALLASAPVDGALAPAPTPDDVEAELRARTRGGPHHPLRPDEEPGGDARGEDGEP